MVPCCDGAKPRPKSAQTWGGLRVEIGRLRARYFGRIRPTEIGRPRPKFGRCRAKLILHRPNSGQNWEKLAGPSPIGRTLAKSGPSFIDLGRGSPTSGQIWPDFDPLPPTSPLSRASSDLMRAISTEIGPGLARIAVACRDGFHCDTPGPPRPRKLENSGNSPKTNMRTKCKAARAADGMTCRHFFAQTCLVEPNLAGPIGQTPTRNVCGTAARHDGACVTSTASSDYYPSDI